MLDLNATLDNLGDHLSIRSTTTRALWSRADGTIEFLDQALLRALKAALAASADSSHAHVLRAQLPNIIERALEGRDA